MGSPIPLHRYRSFKKIRTHKRADRITQLPKQLDLPATASGAVPSSARQNNVISFPIQSLVDPDPFQELVFPNAIAAKRAIADYLGRALAKLTPEQLAKVNSIVETTLNKKEVMQQIRDYFNSKYGSSP